MADPLVTLDEAKGHLRVLHDDEDTLIETYIGAASDAVRDIASNWDGVGPVPDRLKVAVLSRVAIMFDNRESVQAGAGELPMLTPLRALEL
ncbi:head-tail connector protein [Alteriqipengyuania lutimaris]|uniref:head-tail connector protein n=1 Tax=Alteriqipengyuania lutimaris TaxID=1538146 RepID=UPI001CFF124C|nr:head-tail connector protein [Alteriqipengyuania lutimaris]